MAKLIGILLIFVFSVSAWSQTPDLAAFLKTENGSRVGGYFAAFNSGDESKLKAFFLENITPEALKDRPVERRLEFHRQLRDDLRTVEIKKIDSVSENEIKVTAQSANGGWVSYTFSIDPVTKKFEGFRIEQTEAPSEVQKPVPAYQPPANRTELVATAEKMFADLSKNDTFSGVVVIAKDGEPFFSKAYGLADAGTKVPNKVDTRFNLGSINKDFTRIAIGQLIKQGKLSWDDKLIKVLPDYPNRDAASKITIGQLVTMRSGIGDFVNDRFWAMDRSKLRGLKDFFELFADQPLLFEPGTSRRYSNGGYIVLGLIIEELSGMSYYDYVHENIFKPAGMNNTDSFFMDKLPLNTAFGYTVYHQKSGTSRGRNDTVLSARGSSAGGGYSTAADLLKFVTALRTKKLAFPDDSGNFPEKFEGLGSAGGSEGVNALLESDERTGYTVIVLSNFDPPSAEKPGLQLMEWLRKIRQ